MKSTALGSANGTPSRRASACRPIKLLNTVENALKIARLEEENLQLRRRVGRFQIVGQSEAMRRLMAQVERVAASESRVCILGETGTGKELVARAVHERSRRRDHPFVTLNCAAVPTKLIESELFGHEKGSFTGAAARHLGKFEQAQGGTLFIDEIGDMPAAMQAKLLRLLQEGELERIGGEKPVAVNTRVVVATHRDLEALVRHGTIREDLYHRIFVFPIVIPPLRERTEDIPLLAEHFAGLVAEQNGWQPRGFTPDALEELKQYGWPGNVRELRNVVERLLLVTDDAVDAAAAREVLSGKPAASSAAPTALGRGTLDERVAAFEREVILEQIASHGYRAAETARALGLERRHLDKKCQELGIEVKTEGSRSDGDERSERIGAGTPVNGSAVNTRADHATTRQRRRRPARGRSRRRSAT